MTKLKVLVLALALGFGFTSSSCVGAAEVRTTAVVSPRLVWIAPGVWVVEDFDYPVFFYGDYYWMYLDGIWYRSLYYNDGFARVTVVPSVVLNIRTPRRYVRYQAPRDTTRVRAVRPHPNPRVRDHRRPALPPRAQSQPRPQTRDHRKR